MFGRGPGLTWQKLALALLVVVAAALWSQFGGGFGGGKPLGGERTTVERPAGGGQQQARAPGGKAWGATIGFANRDRLDEHFEKHGAEFGSIGKAEYLRRAQELRDAPAGGDVLEAVRRDGVVSRFDRRSGAFLAFNPNGVIRTYFRPNDGERYFRRQAERDR
ncbi:MAG: hypothetical protein IPK81_08945 [Rhodospirillales bacterium]|nr:MAG: hypothetical protein IPK81_08945 [Rhodospirillales bacterium]